MISDPLELGPKVTRRRETRGSTKIRIRVTTGLFVGAKYCKSQ